LVQNCSLKAWQENLDFKELVSADPELPVTSHSGNRILFSIEPYLKKIDFIFERVLR